jgi:hypothetical protein
MIKSLQSLITNLDPSLTLEIITNLPTVYPKIEGFHKLNELQLSHNMIDSMERLFPFIHLPSLSKIYLEGNPVMKQLLPLHLQSRRKQLHTSNGNRFLTQNQIIIILN